LIRPWDSVSIILEVSRGSFPWGSYGIVLPDEDVLSIKLEYRLKRAITFDPIVES